jgi:putative ABC transport system ATP-binding protein
MLRDLVDSRGQTVAMVTHDPTAAARADTVVFLADGRIVDRLDRPDASAVAARLAALEG